MALIATDKSAQVFASVVPFPNRATDAGCTVEETLVTPKAEAVMLSATGFKPGVALDIEMNSEGEIQHPSGKTDANGAYEWVVLPFKKGLTKGRAQVSVHAEGCNRRCRSRGVKAVTGSSELVHLAARFAGRAAASGGRQPERRGNQVSRGARERAGRRTSPGGGPRGR